jgi:hypothetical protein
MSIDHPTSQARATSLQHLNFDSTLTKMVRAVRKAVKKNEGLSYKTLGEVGLGDRSTHPRFFLLLANFQFRKISPLLTSIEQIFQCFQCLILFLLLFMILRNNYFIQNFVFVTF